MDNKLIYVEAIDVILDNIISIEQYQGGLCLLAERLMQHNKLTNDQYDWFMQTLHDRFDGTESHDEYNVPIADIEGAYKWKPGAIAPRRKFLHELRHEILFKNDD